MRFSAESIVERGDFPYRVIDNCALIVQISDDKENKLITLNPTGTFIWEKADGNRSLKEIAWEVAKEFGVSKSEALKDLCIFAKDMLSRGLFSLKGGDKN